MPWRSGNRVRLLENGEAYFPAVFKAIRAARHEVIIETFIVFEDKIGLELHAALIEAARRGVQIDVLVDGFGSSDLTPAFKASLKVSRPSTSQRGTAGNRGRNEVGSMEGARGH